MWDNTGRMSDCLPLCSSPHGLCLRTWTDSYQKVRQSLTTMVSFFKNFRLAVPDGPETGDGCIVEGYDHCWLILSQIPFVCVATAFVFLVGDPMLFLFLICPGCVYIIHLVTLYSVVYWHRDMPFQLLGARTRFIIEVIPMIIAAALHHLVEFNYGYIALLVGCTSYFYAYAHFLHVAYDIGGIDVFLGLAMQVLAYMLDVDLLVRALVLSLCFGLSLYRYTTYCAPEVPAHCKKECLADLKVLVED